MKLMKACIAGLALVGLGTPAALAAGGTMPLEKGDTPLPDWEFDGVFGKYDKNAVQRGFQVYVEVCAACHSMELMSYRNLGEPGGPFYNPDDPALTEALVKEFAAQYMVDEVDDFGDTVQRPARPSDKFVSPYPNVQAASAANGGAAPPDFSVIVKARAGGADYIYRLLTGYPDAEEFDSENRLHFDDDHSHGVLTQPAGLYYNPYFAGDTGGNWEGDPRHKPPGGYLAMPPQLSDFRVEYADGTPPTKEQLASDVAHFLAWASEPKLENRTSLGMAVMIYLFFLALLVYFSYKQIWRNVEH
ncbi:cytochrome c1 [Ponticaulis profundi]|uniref:Cytochrome c1 n=1 Tax=Ponticaulis profundi TaxID=2665222 RepID=A0ABW1SAU2_9PROT